MTDNVETQIASLLDDVREFLPRLIDASRTVADLLYLPLTEETWQQFGDVVEGINDLYKTLDYAYNELAQVRPDTPLLASIMNTMTGLANAFQAMNQHMDEENYVHASDMILYEIVVNVERFAAELGETRGVQAERFARNMLFLQERFPVVHAQIQGVERDEERYQLCYAKNGLPNLYVAGISAEVESAYLYSTYDPELEAYNWVQSLVERQPDIIWFGLGFGYHAQVYSMAVPEHGCYLYEPDEQVLLAAMQVVDFEELFSRIGVRGFVLGKTKKERDRFVHEFLRHLKTDANTLSLPAYDQLKLQEKQTFFTNVRNAIIDYDSTFSMYAKYGLQWTKNNLLNLDKMLLSPALVDLCGKLKGYSAVIVGAGPSLAADMEVLRGLSEHVLIIAAGTATQALLNEGIKPHLIVSIDGDAVNFKAFEHLDMERIPFLFSPMIHHQILERKTDHLVHMLFSNDVTMRSLFELDKDYRFFTPTESVTGNAIEAAIYLGCTEVILAGQDLSYPAENIYAPGMVHFTEQQMKEILERATLQVENVQGGQNRTTTGMRSTLASIEELLLQHPHVRFINTTRMGAVIAHTEWEALSSVLHRHQSEQVAEDQVAQLFRQATRFDNQTIARVRHHVLELQQAAQDNERKFRQLAQTLAKLPELARTNVNRCASELMKLNQDIQGIVRSTIFRAVYVQVFRNEFVMMERGLSELTNETSLIERVEITRTAVDPLLRALQEKSPAILEMLDETVRRIEAL